MMELGTIAKNSREEIRLTVEPHHGQTIVNLRVWFRGEDGDYRPGKQGLAFRLELLPAVLAALGRALKEGAA